MILPKIGSIYDYKGNKFGIITQKLLFYVYGLEYSEDSGNGSLLKTISWIDFAMNAKYVGEIKPKNSAY